MGKHTSGGVAERPNRSRTLPRLLRKKEKECTRAGRTIVFKNGQQASQASLTNKWAAKLLTGGCTRTCAEIQTNYSLQRGKHAYQVSMISNFCNGTTCMRVQNGRALASKKTTVHKRVNRPTIKSFQTSCASQLLVKESKMDGR